MEVGAAFGPCLVEDDTIKPKSVQNGIRILHQQCQGRFWKVKNVDRRAKVMAAVPKEM